MRRRLMLVAVVMVLAAGCGDTSSIRVGPLPLCDSIDPAMLLLMAQAVPSAEQIPCVREMPDGWGVRQADIEAGDVELTFGHQGFGEVGLSLTETCSLSPSSDREDLEDTDIDIVEFPGGCVIIESPRHPAAVEMTRVIAYVSREDLRATSGLELRDRG